MHIDANKLVIENLQRVVTCAHANSGPLLREDMRNLNVLDDAPVVAVEDGRVAWVGAYDRLPAAFDTARRVDGRGAVMTPGLIDCHTHPAFVRGRADEFAMRLAGASYEQIAAAGGGILSSMTAVRGATLEKLTSETRRNLERLRRHGVVVAEGKSGYGLSLEHELNQLRAIRDAGEQADMHTVRTCLAAHSLPVEYRGSDEKRAEYLKLVTDEILPAVVRDGLATRADIFHDKGAFKLKEVIAFGEKVNELGLRLTVHADQMHEDGGGEIAATYHADSADHLEFLDPAGVDVMIRNGTCAVLLPGSTYVLKMSQWADGRWMIDTGLTVALATDFNPGSSPVANPAFVMNLAVMYCGMTPEETIAAFTVNAAQALRLNTDEWGVIKPGSRAAFALWDVDHEREIPYYAGTNSCIEVVTCRDWRS